MALACDLTRVANFQWSGAHSGTVFSWLNIGIQGGHHSISHLFGDGGGASPIEKYRAISKWYAEQFASFVARLKSIPEGGGTLLDNTLVVWGNELTDGTFHRTNRMPFILAGGRNMGLVPGRYLTFDSAPHNNLLVSLCQAMGVKDQATFGDARYCTGPLPIFG